MIEPPRYWTNQHFEHFSQRRTDNNEDNPNSFPNSPQRERVYEQIINSRSAGWNDEEELKSSTPD